MYEHDSASISDTRPPYILNRPWRDKTIVELNQYLIQTITVPALATQALLWGVSLNRYRASNIKKHITIEDRPVRKAKTGKELTVATMDETKKDEDLVAGRFDGD